MPYEWKKREWLNEWYVWMYRMFVLLFKKQIQILRISRHIKNIAKRPDSGLTPGGRCCLSFPVRMLGLRPCISMGKQSKSKYECHLLFPNCPSSTSFKWSKGWSESLQTSIVSRMSQRTCLGKLIGHWHIWVFVIWYPPWWTGPRWGGTRCVVPPHCSCCNRLSKVVLWHIGRKEKGRWNPKCWETFIQRGKNGAATVGQNLF